MGKLLSETRRGKGQLETTLTGSSNQEMVKGVFRSTKIPINLIMLRYGFDDVCNILMRAHNVRRTCR